MLIARSVGCGSGADIPALSRRGHSRWRLAHRTGELLVQPEPGRQRRDRELGRPHQPREQLLAKAGAGDEVAQLPDPALPHMVARAGTLYRQHREVGVGSGQRRIGCVDRHAAPAGSPGRSRTGGRAASRAGGGSPHRRGRSPTPSAAHCGGRTRRASASGRERRSSSRPAMPPVPGRPRAPCVGRRSGGSGHRLPGRARAPLPAPVPPALPPGATPRFPPWVPLDAARVGRTPPSGTGPADEAGPWRWRHGRDACARRCSRPHREERPDVDDRCRPGAAVRTGQVARAGVEKHPIQAGRFGDDDGFLLLLAAAVRHGAAQGSRGSSKPAPAAVGPPCSRDGFASRRPRA